MKKKVFKLLFAIICLLGSTSVSAYDFKVDGIYYEVVSMRDFTCKVVNNGTVDCYTGDIEIPATLSYDNTTWTVVGIGDDAFYECRSVTNVTIPNSVTKIGLNAFAWCCFTSITIPNSVTEIGIMAFYCCASLTDITIPNSVTEIGISTFYGCSSLTSVTLPNSITMISATMFQECSNLTNVTIPNSITMIGDYAFRYCI